MALVIVGSQRLSQSFSPRRKAHQMIAAIKNSGPLEPRNLFVEMVLAPESEADTFPVLSPDAVAVLDTTRPDLQVPLDAVATAARLPETRAMEMLTNEAIAVFKNEPVRKSQADLCENFAPVLETELSTCRNFESTSIRTLKGANVEKRVLAE